MMVWKASASASTRNQVGLFPPKNDNVMTWTMWLFHYKEGNWVQVPETWYDGFRAGEIAAKEPEGTILQFAQVAIELDDGEPVGAKYPWFVVHEVAEGGFINREREELAKRAGVEMALGPVLDVHGEGNVIAASSKFARRQHDHLARWEPTYEQNEALLRALRRLGVPC